MRRLLFAAVLLSPLAACEIGGGTETFGIPGNCSPVGNACAAHADCCSYGCELGSCVRNPLLGGACRTSDDCDWTMTCVGGACAAGAVCRNDTDVCTYDNACCSGNCAGLPAAGTCQPNRPPTVDLGPDRNVPYWANLTLTPAAADPDGDTLVFGWTLVSGPSGHGLGPWTSSLRNPTVFPDVPGPYVFRLVVTDGPSTQRNRLTAQDEVTITAVNDPPAVNAGADVPSQLRNVPVTLTGTVSDPNGAASPLTCAWLVTPPGGAESVAQSFAPCPAAPAYAFTPPIGGPEGVWTFRLEASDGMLTASGTRTVTVVNAPPVANAGPDRVGNLGTAGQPAPAVPLAGSATDANGDVSTPGFAWEWTVTSVPGGSSIAPGTLLGTAASAAFVPDVAGTYGLRLRVDDGRGGTHDDLVTVLAEPYLRPLLPLDGSGLPRGEIVDAVHLKASDRIVMVGTDRSGASPAYRLWVLDPDSAAAPVAVALGAEPACLGPSPDEAEALVGQVGSRWQRVTGIGGTPAVSLVFNGPFTPNDVVHAGSRWYSVGTSGLVYELFSNGTSAAAPCQNCDALNPLRGTRATSQSGLLWLLDENGDALARYIVRPNGNLERTPAGFVAGLAGVQGLWLSADGLDLAIGNGAVYDAATLVPDASGLGFAPAHLDTSLAGGALQGVAVPSAGAGTLVRLDAAWASAGTLPVPQVGVAGTGYPATARFAFVRSSGTHHAIVRASIGGAERFYLATY